MSLPEWASAFVTLTLGMTKEESDDYCRGCHMATYQSDGFVQNCSRAQLSTLAARRQEVEHHDR